LEEDCGGKEAEQEDGREEDELAEVGERQGFEDYGDDMF
jgi:hypothetical protein